MKRTLFSLSLFIVSTSLAATSFMCPKTYTYIYPGDDIGQVLKACGKPNQSTTRTARVREMTENTQTWIYPANGLSVVIQNGVVTKLNHSKASATAAATLCTAAHAIAIGMTEANVAYLCGTPLPVNQVQYQYRNVEETVWTYQSNPTIPSTQLIFRDQRLYAIQ